MTVSIFQIAFAPVQEEPYLADVARLEWHMHTARHAADCNPLTGAELARAIDQAAGDVSLRFAPAASLLVSPYPVFSLWRANTADEDRPYPQSFSGSECVLVTRPALAPEAISLTKGTAEFVAVLVRAKSLQTAAAEAFAANPEFSVQRAVALLVAQRTILSVTPTSPRGTL